MQLKSQKFCFLVLAFGMTIFFGQASDAANGFYGKSEWFTTETPAKYCVYNGMFWGFGEKRCVSDAQARALNMDEAKIFGMANNPTALSQLERGQTDIDNAKRVLAQKQKAADNLRSEVKSLQDSLDNGRFFSRKEIQEKEARLAVLQKDAAVAETELAQARKTVDGISTGFESVTAGTSPDAAILKAEITKRGLLAKFNEYERLLVDFETGLRATESELSNTALEAFVVAKLNKLSANFCDAAAMCAKDPGAVKDWLTGKVASDELKNSFKKSTPVPATGDGRK